MSRPLVSVIIPFCNYERYLGEAIESVLKQSYELMELILVDDSSTDGSAAIAKRYVPPGFYLWRENGGTGAARNSGIDHASGDFIAFCDADDRWEPAKLEVQMAAFTANPDLDVVFTHVQEFISTKFQEPLKVRSANSRAPGVLPSTMLIRRRALDRVGPFSESYQTAEWADWYVRMRELDLTEGMLPEVLVARRLHPFNNGLLQCKARAAEYAHILKRHIDRCRNRQ
jgi:glycosyltransferase involved in cell wall biosynthesis